MVSNCEGSCFANGSREPWKKVCSFPVREMPTILSIDSVVSGDTPLRQTKDTLIKYTKHLVRCSFPVTNVYVDRPHPCCWRFIVRAWKAFWQRGRFLA